MRVRSSPYNGMEVAPVSVGDAVTDNENTQDKFRQKLLRQEMIDTPRLYPPVLFVDVSTWDCSIRMIHRLKDAVRKHATIV